MNPLQTFAPKGIVVSKDVAVVTRDGIRLSTDLYRPALDGEPLPGPFPTILCRTPYDKTDRRYAEIGEFFTPHGYVVAIQDLRDRYRSEGTGDYEHTATPHEGRDGHDTVEWLASRPWSNGKVGMVGSSFAAVTQVRAALERPPHLSAIWPDVTPTDNYQHQAREGGAMQLHMFWALFIHVQDAQELRDFPDKQAEVWDDLRQIRRLLNNMPWKRGQLALRHAPKLEDMLFQYYTRACRDAWWDEERNNNARYFHRHADIPGTFSGGWFDPYATAMTEYYSAMARQNRSAQRLIMGPWGHVGMRGDASYINDVDFGVQSVWGVDHYFRQQLRFFDHTLRDMANDWQHEAPVRIFVMGGGSGRKNHAGRIDHGGCWRDEQEWPLPRARATPYYLHGDGSLSPHGPPADARPRSFVHDPLHPVPTLGGPLCAIMELPADGPDAPEAMWSRYLHPVLRLRNIVNVGPMDQRETATTLGASQPGRRMRDRADLLVFQTPALTEALEVTGPIVVHLYIASTAPDTDFTAKLIDVHPANADFPDGFDMNLSDSVMRCRFRDGWDREVMMESGKAYAICIRLSPVSNRFEVGHRIRIDVASSNFPRLDVNPNTGEPLGRHTHTRVASNTVFVDQVHPSHVILPVIPALGV